MKIIMYISDIMIPLVMVIIIAYGLLKKVSVFDSFTKGAVEGFKIVYHILPTIIGLMVSVNIFRASGALDIVTDTVKPLTDIVHFPSEIVPLALMRTISSSAALGLVLDIFKQYGPDSLIGRMTSIMMGCTETILYTMTVYFMSIGIRKTKYTLAGALTANIAGIIASAILTYAIFQY